MSGQVTPQIRDSRPPNYAERKWVTTRHALNVGGVRAETMIPGDGSSRVPGQGHSPLIPEVEKIPLGLVNISPLDKPGHQNST